MHSLNTVLYEFVTITERNPLNPLADGGLKTHALALHYFKRFYLMSIVKYSQTAIKSGTAKCFVRATNNTKI